MPQATYNGVSVEVDAQGFFADPLQWQEAMAAEIAKEVGVDALTEGHWNVINFMRAQYLKDGDAPSVRGLSKMANIPIKELYTLFPKGPAKSAARVAGIPKPRGCI